MEAVGGSVRRLKSEAGERGPRGGGLGGGERNHRCFWIKVEISVHTTLTILISTLTSAYPSDGIATSFGVTRWNNCSAGFPFCVAGGLGLPSVEYTEYYARSVDLFAERAGPVSLLPASENQKTVIKWNTSEGAVQ